MDMQTEADIGPEGGGGLLSTLQMRSRPKPRRFFMYGTPGIGKTTFATKMPKPVFLQTEECEIDVPTFGLIRTYDRFMECIGALYNEKHDYKTLVVDSVDWLEPIIHAETCRQNGWASIQSVDWGRGYNEALHVWRIVLDGFSALRDEVNMTIMLLGHSEIHRFDSPETEPYDQFIPKLHRKASALVREHVDNVFFASYYVTTTKTDVGFNKKAVRGIGAGNRLIHTNERPAFLAKNRDHLPDTLPLDWNVLASHIPFYNMQAANGTEVNG